MLKNLSKKTFFTLLNTRVLTLQISHLFLMTKFILWILPDSPSQLLDAKMR